MDFTQDERFLMMLYSPGTRPGLVTALREMRCFLTPDEGELLELTDRVLEKLGGMSDEAFDRLDLYREL